MNLKKIVDTANLLKESTGLNNDIWVSGKYAKHSPRLKVYVDEGDETISVSIDDNPKQVAGRKGAVNPKDLQLVAEWIKLNKEQLLNYWNSSRVDTKVFVNSLKKI